MLLLMALVLLVGTAVGFTSPAAATTTAFTRSQLPRPRTTSGPQQPLHMMMPLPHEAAALTDHLLQLPHHLPATTQWLADAAVAAAENKDVGWWGQYINFFKSALEFVHSTVEGPLKAVGIEQTWGPSIAIFTARE